MMSEVFQIDDIDRRIIKLIQEKPNLTHTQIAKKVNRSQPTIGLRIRKLEQAGVLKFQAGLNMKAADLIFAKVEIQTNHPEHVLRLVKDCPFLINAFKLSGDFNVMLIAASFDLKHLDHIINAHFRSSSHITDVRIEVITDVLYDFVLPIDLNFEKCSCDLETKCFEEDF
jgi:DNA-binding Lrp family transcriptional regulator